MRPGGVVTASAMRAGVLTVAVLTLAQMTASPADAMDFHGMEDNCILSFVVPRDKVKSSCDMEERVRRRLNAMETKVTLYKQHVQELQEQLGKERQLHQQSLDDLHHRLILREQAERPQHPDLAVDKRLQGLEEELRKMRTVVNAASSSASPHLGKPGQVPSGGLGEKPHGRGAAGVGGGGGLGLGLLSHHHAHHQHPHSVGGRSREEEEKALTVLVKSVVHSEVKKLFDNYTHYVGRYVRDQALAFNQIMNMVPRPDQPYPGLRDLPPKWPQGRPAGQDFAADLGGGGGGGDSISSPTPQPLDSDAAQLVNQLEGIRSRLNSSVGQNLAHRVHHALSGNRSVTTPTPAPAVAAAAEAASTQPPNDAGVSLEISDSSSGDANETAGDQRHPSFTATPNAASGSGAAAGNASNRQNPHSVLPMPSSSHQDSESLSQSSSSSSSAQSRMSYNADLNKLPDHPSGDRDSGAESGGDGSSSGGSNVSGWQESMVHDQSAGQWIEELLRTKVQAVLQQQVEEVVSLVLKHGSMMDAKLQDAQVQVRQLEQRMAADVKHLSQEVSGVRLELGSVSQGLQVIQGRAERVAQLEQDVADIRRNISQEGGSRLLATLLDEQGKKVRKMERLTAIYKQSLEHYRNETKLEYRGLRDRLDKEAGSVHVMHAQLTHNVTRHAAQLNLQLNHSLSNRMAAILHRVQVMEDASLLQQIDLSTFERQMKSKTSKAERDLSKMSHDVGELRQRTRNLQKNMNAALTGQEHLERAVNSSALQMRHLQIEVQLNVLDDWVPYHFDYMKTRTDCFGEQYIRKSGFKTGRLVGAVLCSHSRYKIFLGQSLVDTFKNIGDDSGMGEDHCQFVNARSMAKVKVSPFRTSTETEPGYVRTHWGQEPRPELLNIIRPSPAWYECGVTIP